MQFSSALSYIDSLQAQVTDTAKGNEKELQVLKETMANNVQLINTSLAEIYKRVKALK